MTVRECPAMLNGQPAVVNSQGGEWRTGSSFDVVILIEAESFFDGRDSEVISPFLMEKIHACCRFGIDLGVRSLGVFVACVDRICRATITASRSGEDVSA